MKKADLDYERDIRWLLHDKYHYSAEKISAVLQVIKPNSASDFSSAFPRELQQDFQRLAAGEPLAYVIGWVTFLDCHIDLSSRTLIPRPETEFWVEQIIKEKSRVWGNGWQTEPSPSGGPHILDLCCGSGCIGIACLKAWPPAQGDFIDLMPNAIQQVQRNLELNNIQPQRVKVIQSDLFEKLDGERIPSYDLILTNPPYVDPNGKVSPELAHEPAESLFAQNHGLELIEQIIFQAKKYLKPIGELIMEFGQGQESQIQNFAETAGWQEIQFRADQYGVKRWVRLRNTGNAEGQTKRE